MPCQCATRLRRIMVKLGWRLSSNFWKSPHGKTVLDEVVEHKHALIVFYVLFDWALHGFKLPKSVVDLNPIVSITSYPYANGKTIDVFVYKDGSTIKRERL